MLSHLECGAEGQAADSDQRQELIRLSAFDGNEPLVSVDDVPLQVTLRPSIPGERIGGCFFGRVLSAAYVAGRIYGDCYRNTHDS